MKLPLQVVFRDLAPSEALEASVRKRVDRLERLYDRVMSCRVIIEKRHRRRHRGNLYHVRVDLKVPGSELVVSREPGEQHSHEDAYVAIRDAFRSLRRNLEEHARIRRGEVKNHAASVETGVTPLRPEDGSGRRTAADDER